MAIAAFRFVGLLLLFAILSFKIFRADAKLCEEYLAEI